MHPGNLTVGDIAVYPDFTLRGGQGDRAHPPAIPEDLQVAAAGLFEVFDPQCAPLALGPGHLAGSVALDVAAPETRIVLSAVAPWNDAPPARAAARSHAVANAEGWRCPWHEEPGAAVPKNRLEVGSQVRGLGARCHVGIAEMENPHRPPATRLEVKEPGGEGVECRFGKGRVGRNSGKG